MEVGDQERDMIAFNGLTAKNNKVVCSHHQESGTHKLIYTNRKYKIFNIMVNLSCSLV